MKFPVTGCVFRPPEPAQAASAEKKPVMVCVFMKAQHAIPALEIPNLAMAPALQPRRLANNCVRLWEALARHKRPARRPARRLVSLAKMAALHRKAAARASHHRSAPRKRTARIDRAHVLRHKTECVRFAREHQCHASMASVWPRRKCLKPARQSLVISAVREALAIRRLAQRRALRRMASALLPNGPVR